VTAGTRISRGERADAGPPLSPLQLPSVRLVCSSRWTRRQIGDGVVDAERRVFI
jgi:hypothetical protein